MARERKRSKDRRSRRPAPVRPEGYGDAAKAFGEGEQLSNEDAVDAIPDFEPGAIGQTFAVPDASVTEGASGEVFDDELDDDEHSSSSTAVATKPQGNRVVGFLRASWAELQRVQWPDRRQVFQATAVVMGFVVVAGVYLGVADYVSQKIVNAIL